MSVKICSGTRTRHRRRYDATGAGIGFIGLTNEAKHAHDVILWHLMSAT